MTHWASGDPEFFKKLTIEHASDDTLSYNFVNDSYSIPGGLTCCVPATQKGITVFRLLCLLLTTLFLCCPICLEYPYPSFPLSTLTCLSSAGSGITTSSWKPCILFLVWVRGSTSVHTFKIALLFSSYTPDPLLLTPPIDCEFLEGRNQAHVALNTSPGHRRCSKSFSEGKEENPMTLNPNDFSRLCTFFFLQSTRLARYYLMKD